MAMTRRVEPEWLDTLPAADPRARRSRRDLRRVNTLMLNAWIVRRELREAVPAGARRVAELGAGDGAFALRILPPLAPGAAPAAVTLVDRQPADEPGARERLRARGWEAAWIRCDVFDWLARDAGPFDAIVANLFLHHFEAPALEALLAGVARRTAVFIACEPRRSRPALWGARLLGLAGCNGVTRHDAVVSVRAGFRDGELSRAWPRGGGWRLQERGRGLFSHGFVARR